jgi:hypothetical protein
MSLLAHPADTRPALRSVAANALLATWARRAGAAAVDAAQSLRAGGAFARAGASGDSALSRTGAALGWPLNATMFDAARHALLWNEQAALLTAAAAAAPQSLSGDPNALAGGAIVIAFLVVIALFVPYYICPHLWVLLLSLLIGWTGIGWLGLLVYSLFFCKPKARCHDAHAAEFTKNTKT